MNPRRQFRRLRDDDRWVGLPPTRVAGYRRAAPRGPHPRTALLTTGVALLIAGLVTAALWAGLTGLRPPVAAAPAPLPTSSARPAPVRIPCTEPARLAPVGCSTYTAVAAAGVPGGTRTWAGTTAPTVAVRVLDGRTTAVIATACNGITVPVTITETELVPDGSIASTAMGCGGARRLQERWLMGLFGQTVHYALDGPDLTLTAGGKVLVLSPSSTTTPTPTPTPTPTSPHRATTAPTSRAVVGPGCPATSATTPAGAFTATIADVDGDRRRDTEWAVARGGAIEFGITTASGATVSGRQGFAGGGDRSFVVGRLADGVVVAITSEGRDSPVFTFSGCAFHVLRGKDLLPGTDARSPFTLYSEESGGNGGCYGGRLALIDLLSTPGGTGGSVIARWIDVSRDGLHATLTDRTGTIAKDIGATTDPKQDQRYDGISCGPSPVLHPVVRSR